MMAQNEFSEGMVLMIKGILNGFHRHLELFPDLDRTSMKSAVDRFIEEDVVRRSGVELKTEFGTQEKCLRKFLKFIHQRDL